MIRTFAASRARSEQGSASVEFAASAIVFFLTLIGLMKMCLAIYTFHFVSEAAREGARFAIVRGSACSGFGSACPASKTDIQNYVQSLSYPGISSAAETVITTYSAYPTGTSCTPSASCNNPGNLATIKVSYAFPLAIPFMTTKTYTMSSTAEMVISQ
jgi:Flp pilus assembly protein TadG